MSVTDLLRARTPSSGGAPDHRTLRGAALAGAGAAAVSACAFVLPALLVWVATSQSTVDWTTALGVGASLWLLGTGAHLVVGAAHVSIVPLAFLALAVLGAARGALRTARPAAQDRTLSYAADLVHRPVAQLLGAWTGGYAACALAWSVVAFAAGPAPTAPSLVMPVVVVPVLAAALALSRLVRGRPELLGARGRRPAWLPDAVRRAVRPGLEGAALLLGAGVAICVLMVVLRYDRVSHLQSTLAPGVIGGVVLTVAQLLVVPNLGLWAVSFVAGTGFSSVQGAWVSWTGSRTSLLPMVPVLGALPDPGAFPGYLPVVVLLPVLVGVLVGWRSIRAVARLSSARTKLTVVSSAVLVSACSLGLLDAVAGASVGSARLSDIGAPAGRMTVALVVELGIGAALVFAWDRWRPRR
jgi:Family of unknown function (DUF6350)